MTKFKEYLMARGAILERNSAELARDENWDVEFIIPKVLDSGLAISYCHVDDHVPDVVVYDRSGACRYIRRSEYQAHVGNRHHDPEYPEYIEYIDWLCHTSCEISTTLFPVAACMYEKDKKVRIAFKHMLAGIMDEEVFYKYIVRQYPKYIRSV